MKKRPDLICYSSWGGLRRFISWLDKQTIECKDTHFCEFLQDLSHNIRKNVYE